MKKVFALLALAACINAVSAQETTPKQKEEGAKKECCKKESKKCCSPSSKASAVSKAKTAEKKG